jgi:small subunit ribosomal protein S6
VTKYEFVFILKTEKGEGDLQSRIDRAKSIIASHGGEVTAEDHWGVRRLAYEIDDVNMGDYMLMRFDAKGTVVAELDRAFRLDDLCLRHLIVRDENWTERNRAAMAKRRAVQEEHEAAGADE